MDYKEKYNELVNAIKVLQETNPSDEGIQNWVNDNVPELAESEDEKMRKALTEGLCDVTGELGWSDFGGIPIEEIQDWLEKQGSNLVENGYTNNKDIIKYADNYSHAIWHKLMDNFKNIKDYHIGCNDVSDIVLNAIINTYNWLEKQDKQKHIEKDLEMVNPSDKAEQKSAWGEEDEETMSELLSFLLINTPEQWAKYGKWLKSLKERYTWKPSKEQLKFLQHYADQNNYDGTVLTSLLNDLKKL